MKKYSKVSFNEASFYEYTDPSKTAVRMTATTSDDVDGRFMNLYFLNSDSHSKELFSKRVVRNEDLEDGHIDLGYLELRGASIKRCSRTKVLSELRELSGELTLGSYEEFVRRLLVESPECFKLAQSAQVVVDRRSVRKEQRSFKLNKDPYAEIRLMEIRRQRDIIEPYQKKR